VLLLCILLGSVLGWSSTGGCNLVQVRHQFILLHVSGELVVGDVLLGLDQDVLELHVELGSLVEEHGELLLHDDGLVELLEELVLLRIVSGLG
jgi:hypothetical protein